MRKFVILGSALLLGSANVMADGLVRDILSSGLTTGSTYLTFRDHKLVAAARDDAGSYVATDGNIRGPYLEAALRQIRTAHPDLQASDMELASAIVTTEVN
ncbi:DUF2388 domain-containing protein [Pseudomonas matsuisoli]|uniref:Uncharacterized protein n=1 Tax=Pseudomonas matsuisoli TaxID=1515666 RepID=A0A917Q085_9PSED|nr:DUF2388 domain-containing protein [Pseudomonas matsuisoli]GGK03319.1 hypothetical protein GCM10009304_31410 [Pseudomonas matsuisoli]